MIVNSADNFAIHKRCTRKGCNGGVTFKLFRQWECDDFDECAQKYVFTPIVWFQETSTCNKCGQLYNLSLRKVREPSQYSANTYVGHRSDVETEVVNEEFREVGK